MADEVKSSIDPVRKSSTHVDFRWPAALAATFAVAVPFSYLGAFDRLTWWLESLPALIALPILVGTWRRYPLSNLLYTFIFVHALILLIGGHYTYARVPLGDWASHLFGWSRNNYDKLGHFAQGFVPALLTREILIRFSPFRLAPRSRFIFILADSGPARIQRALRDHRMAGCAGHRSSR